MPSNPTRRAYTFPSTVRAVCDNGAPMDVEILRFSRFCAPTALAGLMGCLPTEAAELLASTPGIMYAGDPTGVNSIAWHDWLRGQFGGVELPTRRPDDEAEARRKDARRRADARWERYNGPIWGWNGRLRGPRDASPRVATHYTVAQFLAMYSQGAVMLSVRGHTLLARDGKVVADTRESKSMRARVVRATLIPGA